jgi:hypothetical protein
MTGDTSRAAITASDIEKARLLSKPIRGDELLTSIQDALAAARA